MSKVDDKIKAETKKPKEAIVPTKSNPYIRPKHRAIFERMKQGETITGAMIAMSYAPSVVNRPTEVTKSKSWQALMEEQLPEDHVAMRHREILDKRQYRTVTKAVGRGKNKKYVHEVIDDGPDPMVMRGVELAYKLRGRTKDETPPADRPNIYNLFYQPNVQASVKSFEDALKYTIAHEIVRQDTDVAPEVPEAGRDTLDAGTTGDTDAGPTEGTSGEARDDDTTN